MINTLGKIPLPGTCVAFSFRQGTSIIVCLCLSLLIVGANSEKTHRVEVKALRSIKKSLSDPYRNLRSWKKGDPCTSNWAGIFCYNTTLEDGRHHIKEMALLNMNLSGSLSPELGRLSYMKILDFMWNNITGTIPKEIGNITTLELLLLSGNQLTGSLPDELGYLFNLDRIQIDENHIYGPIPVSFSNMRNAKHTHMNNNSLSGQIPSELSQLPVLVHLLLDNNNLSGYLPSELSQLPNLRILQLDNNNFNRSTIPSSYGNMTRLLKLSLRNCSLEGGIPNWSNMSNVAYIDLSLNRLTGSIPTSVLSENITTIDLSSNNLNGTIPTSFSRLPLLQTLSLANNSLTGSVPSIIWQNRILKPSEKLILDFENNRLSTILGSLVIPPNISIRLQGNPVLCSNQTLVRLCGLRGAGFSNTLNTTKHLNDCLPQSCPPPYEYAPPSPATRCFCAAPLYIGYRMKSPGFSDFLPYFDSFKMYLSSGLGLNRNQLDVRSASWQKGPRLSMQLEIFPMYVNDSVRIFNRSEVLRILSMFGGWRIPHNDVFGPFELLNITLSDAYDDEFPPSPSGIRKGVLVLIVLGTIAGSVALTVLASLLILRWNLQNLRQSSKTRLSSRISMKVDGMKDFTYSELAVAANSFSSSNLVGEGGYGKVYRGVLDNGTVVAIKRAQKGSLQGDKEFLTEIELLSRIHHRNLVSLIGYCDEESEQMLIYEFMSNGTLRDYLSGKKTTVPMSFGFRVRIALEAARGILYLHTEADPPIFHRDIKARNILLDSKYTAKVADFGLSRLAPVPGLEGEMPSYVSTAVKGTPGYLDPEYFLTHKLTDKSDVYSLGVVFMELITGMHPISHGKNLVREVRSAYCSGMILSIIDERMGSYPWECMEKFLNLCLKCCEDETDERPRMVKVVRELENICVVMQESYDVGTESYDMGTESSARMTSPSSSSPSSSLLPTTPYLSQHGLGGSGVQVRGVVPGVRPR